MTLRVQLVHKPTSPRTGIGRYGTELERGLRALDIELRVAPLRTPLPHAATAMGHRAGYDLDAFFRTYPLRAGIAPGYVTHLTSQTLGILLSTQRLPRPLVVTVHDILPRLLRDDPALNVYRNRAQRWVDALAMRGLRRADRLIAVSHYTRSTLVDSLGIPAGRIDVVHEGVDTDRFRPAPVPESLRERYGLAPDRQYVLYVGSEDPRKCVPDLLRAFAVVRERQPGAVLLKVGTAAFIDQRARHLQLCTELGIADAVRWIDDVPDEDLPGLYNAADVLAFPSRQEGFGFPVLEALASGTPVLAMRASSVPELVGDAAMLVDGSPDFAGALMALLDHGKPEPRRLREQAQRFNWTTTITDTISTYRRVLADASQAGMLRDGLARSATGLEGER